MRGLVTNEKTASPTRIAAGNSVECVVSGALRLSLKAKW
ncbi:hypothetical protein EVB74_003 [Rhizobium phage RHph_Y3_56_1]|nr:hypothetical protein EVB59_003 [Rhizobium phage RHph_Y3_1]QIG77952.1 hypothetical protein EVB74_003 [Rhizobium phage RHph_Y3_56_1]